MINRRKFLKYLGLSGLFPAKYFDKSNESRKIYLGDFFIAGFKYYEGENLINFLKEGDELIFKRQQDNNFDEMAIEIYTKENKKIGYMPMDLNFIPANLMDQNIKLTGIISEIDHKAESWEKVIVSVYQLV